MKLYRHTFLIMLFAVAPVGSMLVSCADSPVGLGRAGVNEFLITSYPPLTTPPNLVLRPPSNAEAIEQAKSSTQAKQLLFGLPVKVANKLSAAEKNFLQKIGTDKADPDIRKHLAEDRGLAILDSK